MEANRLQQNGMNTEATAAPAKPRPAENTIRIGSIDIGLPPDPSSPISVTHYINKNRGPIFDVAREYYEGGLVPQAILDMPTRQQGIAAVFTILTTGLELGIGYATALRAIYVIEGRASLSADLMRGLAMQAGCRFEYRQRDDQACIIDVYRDERKIGTASFTREEAAQAGLVGNAKKPNWKNYTADMLAARAGAKAARMGAPDRLAGLYDPDELEPVQRVKSAPETVYTVPVAVREAVAAVQRPAPTDTAGVELMTPDQRKMLFALAGNLGLKGKRDYPNGSGGVETRSVIEADEELGGEPIVVATLTKDRASEVIDILARRDEERANRDELADATEALGGAQ